MSIWCRAGRCAGTSLVLRDFERISNEEGSARAIYLKSPSQMLCKTKPKLSVGDVARMLSQKRHWNPGSNVIIVQ